MLTSDDLKGKGTSKHEHRLVEFNVRTSTQEQRRQAEALTQRLGGQGFRVVMCAAEGCNYVELVKSRPASEGPPESQDKMLRPQDVDRKDVTP